MMLLISRHDQSAIKFIVVRVRCLANTERVGRRKEITIMSDEEPVLKEGYLVKKVSRVAHCFVCCCRRVNLLARERETIRGHDTVV